MREIDDVAIGAWYENLTGVRSLSPGTAVRHFNVMHHMMKKATTIWSKETGLDLRHTFASWYMMNAGDLYELAKILGHANIEMTERHAKLGRQHITKTCNVAREMWKLMEQEKRSKQNIP